MDKMEDENDQLQFAQVYSKYSSIQTHQASPEDLQFDQIISTLQEILIDPAFEKTLSNFMRNHWNILNEGNNPAGEAKVFQLYRGQLQKYLHNRIVETIPNFEWKTFGQLFQTRNHRVDQQILDTLQSLEQVECFKMFIKDYKNSFEEQEMFKVLTIKSNKIPESKKVKGKDNIFAGDGGAGLFDKGLKAPMPKKSMVKEKTEEELFVPDLILTVKPMRKA